MKFTVDNNEYELDLDKLTYDEAEFVYDNTKMGIWEFGDGLRQGVPKAIKALIILGKRRAGIATRWQDIPGSFEISAPTLSVLEGMFRPLFEADAAESGEGEATPDPTTPGPTPGSEPGTDPGSDATATSSA